MSSLKDLQARFQAGILSGDDSVLTDVKDGEREDRSVLFGVYRNVVGQFGEGADVIVVETGEERIATDQFR